MLAKDFIDREKTINELKQDLLSGQSVILYSQRRIGKTSLILELFSRMKGTIPVYIDISGITTKRDIAKIIVLKTIEASHTTIDRIIETVKEFLEKLKPKIIVENGKASIEISYDRSVVDEGLIEALDLPQRIAEKRGKKVIVAFDEFQEIALIDGEEMEKLMRSRFQMHDKVSYIFAGSRKHIIREMFESKSKAFFKFGKMILLGNIPKEEFFVAIKNRFEETGKSIKGEFVNKILEITGGHPYYTQQLCHELWYLTEKKVEESLIEESVENILSHNNDAFELMWQSVRTNMQKSLLIGMCKEENANFYSEDFIKKYELKSYSHVQKCLKALEKKEIIENNNFTDIFFKEWIRGRFV